MKKKKKINFGCRLEMFARQCPAAPAAHICSGPGEILAGCGLQPASFRKGLRFGKYKKREKDKGEEHTGNVRAERPSGWRRSSPEHVRLCIGHCSCDFPQALEGAVNSPNGANQIVDVLVAVIAAATVELGIGWRRAKAFLVRVKLIRRHKLVPENICVVPLQSKSKEAKNKRVKRRKGCNPFSSLSLFFYLLFSCGSIPCASHTRENVRAQCRGSRPRSRM